MVVKPGGGGFVIVTAAAAAAATAAAVTTTAAAADFVEKPDWCVFAYTQYKKMHSGNWDMS